LALTPGKCKVRHITFSSYYNYGLKSPFAFVCAVFVDVMAAGVIEKLRIVAAVRIRSFIEKSEYCNSV
jgi:hypothetical protein